MYVYIYIYLVNGLGFSEKKPHNKARAYSSVQSAIDKFIYNISQSSKTSSSSSSFV